MALSPPSYVETPHVAYVNFYIGGTNITKYPDGKPRSLQSFTYTNETNDTGTFSLQIVDPQWDFVDKAIIEAYDSKNVPVTFNFGYRDCGGIHSRTYNGWLTNVTPSFYIDGLMLTIEGTGTLAELSLIKRSDSYPSKLRDGVDNFLRIDEIVSWIAKKHGFVPDVEPCKEIKVTDGLGATEPTQMRFIQNNMTDLQFIRNILIPLAVSEKTGESGYVLHVDDDTKRLVFKPEQKRLAPERTFIYMREAKSEVISFEVDYNGSFLSAMTGTEKVTVPYIDANTGEIGVVEKHSDNTPEKVYLSGFKVPFPLTTAMRIKDNTGLISTLPELNKAVAEARAMSRYFNAWNSMLVKAKLTIVGDDNDDIKRAKTCKVIVRKPDGKEHPVSGNWYIYGQVHEVSGGRWTTTLELQREGDRGVGEPVTVGQANT